MEGSTAVPPNASPEIISSIKNELLDASLVCDVYLVNFDLTVDSEIHKARLCVITPNPSKSVRYCMFRFIFLLIRIRLL